MSTQSTPILRELTAKLGELAHSLWLNTDPLERLDLLKEFRIVLDLADEVIAREFPVELEDPTSPLQSFRSHKTAN